MVTSVETLLKKIEKDEELDFFTAQKQMKEVLENARKDNPVLNDAIEGKTDIGGKVDYLIEDHGGWKNYVPSYVGKEEMTEMGHLQHISGNTSVGSNYTNLTANSVGAYLGLTLLVSAMFAPQTARSSKDNIFKAFSENVLFFGRWWATVSFFIAYGAFSGLMQHTSESKARARAHYVQEKIEQVYELNNNISVSNQTYSVMMENVNK